jgi:energy-coupling factor transport system ATP-binding protein
VSAAIVFRDVSFSYPDGPPVLDSVSLEVPGGAFVLVTGATGAGKSTLLRAINGLVPHFSGGSFSGTVTVAGRSTTDHPPRVLADEVTFVPQDPGAAFVLDRVEDELAYALENLGVERTSMRRRIEETLDLLDLDALRNRSVRTLSGGERQRVAIAAALTPRPSVLVLDEPTSQLDPQGAEDVLAALQRLVHDLGLTVVVAEHRLERVAGFVDGAIGCMPGGRVEIGGVADVLDQVGTGPPVSALGRLLGWRPLPLTVRDARRRAALGGEPITLWERGSRSTGRARPDREDRGTSPGTEPLVEAANLGVALGGATVLTGIDLSIRPGEIVALMGRNGAGKTTLLRSLAGLIDPAHGTVACAGARPQPGRKVALCPQTPEEVLFCDRVDAEVAVTLAARADARAGRSGPRRRDEARAWLDRLGIADLAERHPRDLSAGERLLVAVAAVAATGAPLLLLDEPTRGLDPASKARLSELLRRHVCSGGGAMFATHDVELAAELAGRVVMLAGGEVIADGPPAEVLGDSTVFAPQMARVFGPQWLTPAQVAGALGAT